MGNLKGFRSNVIPFAGAGFMSEPPANLEVMVHDRFTALARNPAEEKRFPVGPDSAKRLGYPGQEIDSLPPTATESFAGVGNPFSLGELLLGQRVLDLGCGAGMDSILAARRVGAAGQVIGIDMAEEMVAKARRNAQAAHACNTEFRAGRADVLPVPAACVDVVITNGVFNLCVDKSRVVAELFRVLRPGGRLQMADILLEPHVTPEELAGKGTWSD
jgi:SAM-dependent methyltransferase